MVACNGFVDVAFTPVVSGQSQVPVAKHVVQTLQVIQSGAGRGLHVSAVVAKDVLFEVKTFASGRHELPHAAGTRARHRLWVEGTFNEGQQSQLAGHLALLEFIDDVKQVFA